MTNTPLVTCLSVLLDVKPPHFYLTFIILVFCEGSGGFWEGSVGFRVVPAGFRVVPVRFRVVPAGSGRFRVGSAFYIHPLICFLCFTSLVSVTGSYTEDEPKTQTCRLCRPCRLSTLYSCFCVYFWLSCFGFGHKLVLLCTGHASSQTRSSFPGSLLNFFNTTNTNDRPTVDGTNLAKCRANLLAEH